MTDIKANEFVHIPGANDREYISLLEEALKRQRELTAKAIAKLKENCPADSDCVLKLFGECSYNETGCSDCAVKSKIFKALSERKTGRWIDDGLDYIGPFGAEARRQKCSECGHSFSKLPGEVFPNYCECCGADMRRYLNGDQ